ncbi:MAG: 4Fe-4S dicluster domain-containing protein, partial [Myxococcales bacterium]|nr:4Fe-4S dicluster domain-containing protein [Myxococcales bacterium]
RRGMGEAVAAPPAQHPVRPPGAAPEPAFRASCTRCFLCGEACPSGAIRFPHRVKGAQVHMKPPRGVNASQNTPQVRPEWHVDGTPVVLPWETACLLCMRCGDVCPTGALRPIQQDRDVVAAEVRMGVARIDRKICLPWTRRSWCGACHTACPYRNEAITVDHQNRPTVHEEHCVGCGICVEVCPIRYKAIAVVPPFEPDVGRVRAE